ncbi:DsbA family protein [Nitrosopumilus sp.]|uniref:DsbA family protein n=1 Tax=Nitrosopumilus sp. TaxID=2024843 RepID=UPI003B5AB29C
MSKFVLLAIPVIIGIASGLFLAFYLEPENSTKTILTESKLIQNGSPILGSPDAPITILEWGDYQCTYCYKFHQETLDKIKMQYIETGKVKLVFKDFPLNGPDSILAAEAAFCANDQNKYWEFHDKLYKNWAGERTGWVTRQLLDSFATKIQLDSNQFNDCIDEQKYRKHVLALYDFGKGIGIDATPSFLIFDDEKILKIRGNQPVEVFIKTIAEF